MLSTLPNWVEPVSFLVLLVLLTGISYIYLNWKMKRDKRKKNKKK